MSKEKRSKEMSYVSRFVSTKCNCGPKQQAFVDPATGQTWWGAGENRNYYIHFDHADDDLIINCGNLKPKLMSDGFDCGVAPFPTPTISIPWSDGSIPELLRHDWFLISKRIKEQKDFKNIVVMCLGGHGRTGTALAILGRLCGALGEEPIKELRKLYCKKAVESSSQVKYVSYVTGLMGLTDKGSYEEAWGSSGRIGYQYPIGYGD